MQSVRNALCVGGALGPPLTKRLVEVFLEVDTLQCHDFLVVNDLTNVCMGRARTAKSGLGQRQRQGASTAVSTYTRPRGRSGCRRRKACSRAGRTWCTTPEVTPRRVGRALHTLVSGSMPCGTASATHVERWHATREHGTPEHGDDSTELRQ